MFRIGAYDINFSATVGNPDDISNSRRRVLKSKFSLLGCLYDNAKK